MSNKLEKKTLNRVTQTQEAKIQNLIFYLWKFKKKKSEKYTTKKCRLFFFSFRERRKIHGPFSLLVSISHLPFISQVLQTLHETTALRRRVHAAQWRRKAFPWLHRLQFTAQMSRTTLVTVAFCTVYGNKSCRVGPGGHCLHWHARASSAELWLVGRSLEQCWSQFTGSSSCQPLSFVHLYTGGESDMAALDINPSGAWRYFGAKKTCDNLAAKKAGWVQYFGGLGLT